MLKSGKTNVYCSSSCWQKPRTRANIVVRACLNCGKEFQSTNNKRYRKCCSVKCATTWSQRFVDMEQVSKTLRDKYKSGELTSVSRKKIRTCPECGKNYTGKRVVCSDECLKYRLEKDRERTSQRISETRKKKFALGELIVTGGTTKWIPYKDIKVQGTYELRTCKILDHWIENGSIHSWKYSPTRIKYIGVDGKLHNYIIDFRINRVDGTFYYLETKGRVKENDALKWKAVRDAGNELVIWFLSDIEREESFYGTVV